MFYLIFWFSNMADHRRRRRRRRHRTRAANGGELQKARARRGAARGRWRGRRVSHSGVRPIKNNVVINEVARQVASSQRQRQRQRQSQSRSQRPNWFFGQFVCEQLMR